MARNGIITVEPLGDRKPFIDDSEELFANFSFKCPHCQTQLDVAFSEILYAAWGWHERMEEPLRSDLAKFFSIDLGDKSISHGMHSIVVVLCDTCRTTYFVYFWFKEYANSRYRVALRAIAKIVGPQ